MTSEQHFWYVAEWLQRESIDGSSEVQGWVPKKADVISRSMQFARDEVKHIVIGLDTAFIHLNLYKMGTEEQFLEHQGQLTLEFDSLDPYTSG